MPNRSFFIASQVNWPSGLKGPPMTERQFWIQDTPGNISTLCRRKDRIYGPAIGEARIAIKAVGLNFADVFTALGLYAAAPKTDVIPGLEVSNAERIKSVSHFEKRSQIRCLQDITSGIVEEVGPTNESREATASGAEQTFSVGDRVMGVTRFGAFTSHINAKTHLLQPIPEAWSFQQGAAFLVQGLTAMYGLRSQGNLRQTHTVLIHSAAGGCGQFALAICHSLGAFPIATVGSQKKVEYLRFRFPWLSEQQIIVRDASRFAQQLERIFEAQGLHGIDIVLDAVSGEYFMPGFNALAPGGRYVLYGAANWTPKGDQPGWLRLAYQYLRRPRLDPLQMIGQNRSLLAFNLIYLFDQADTLRQLAVELLDLQLNPPNIAASFDFKDAQAAVRYLQSGTATGKVVLELD